jgi:hypothetical protein
MFKNFDELSSDSKLTLMSYAIRCFSVKPELISETKTDKELLERIDSLARVLYEYAPLKKSESSYGSAPIVY